MQGNSNQLYLDAAVKIACSICRDAIWHKDACNWIGSTNEEYYGVPKGYAKSLQSNFYDGTAGIAFFLCHVLSVYKDDIIQQTAEGALQQIINQELKTAPKNNMGKLGFYTGYPGEAFVLYHAGKVLNKPAYTNAAAQLIKKTIQLPKEDWRMDMIDGAAGAIPALLKMHQQHPDKQLLSFITALGNFLVEKATTADGGVAWHTISDTGKPLTGFGHGAAGIATALLELFRSSGDKKYLETAKAGFAYEDYHFNKTQQNWPDFRDHEKMFPQATGELPAEAGCGIAWCHGAPGIALSRLRAYEITKDAGFLKGAEIAIGTTEKQFSIETLGNYSMCHGITGNAESLLYAAQLLKRPDLITMVENEIKQCITEYIDKGMPVPNGLHSLNETPDFMLGTSGMGYFFLRMYDGEKFPATLILKP